MKKVVAASLAAAMFSGALVPFAEAHQRGTSWTHRILHDYYSVVRQLGKRAAGRDIIRHGVNTRFGPKEPTKHQKAEFQRQLRRLLYPVPAYPVVQRTAVPPKQAPAGTMTASTSANLPACADESHGDYSTGPENTNPSSGATGRWQTLRSHYAPGGVCSGLDVNTKSGQDSCAGLIYKTQGASAWVNC